MFGRTNISQPCFITNFEGSKDTDPQRYFCEEKKDVMNNFQEFSSLNYDLDSLETPEWKDTKANPSSKAPKSSFGIKDESIGKPEPVIDNSNLGLKEIDSLNDQPKRFAQNTFKTSPERTQKLSKETT